MPFELWKKCADEIAAEAPNVECWFSGSGEPLLQPELLLRMISYGKSVGLGALHLNTNGMLLGPELAERILSSGLDVLVFGVDGVTKATYESIRVGGDWDQLFGNIREVLARRKARSSGPEILVQIIEMDENAREVDRFRDYWLQQGAVVKVRRKLSWGGRLATPSSVSKELRIPCPWAITLMHVLWDGRIPRCAGDTEGDDSAGNAWHSSLVELWARLAPHRALHLERRFDELPERCRDCKDWMTGASTRERPQVAKRAGVAGVRSISQRS
jgi:MoaA/NifB/PqqE/SkfB family radical SAM enzyme